MKQTFTIIAALLLSCVAAQGQGQYTDLAKDQQYYHFEFKPNRGDLPNPVSFHFGNGEGKFPRKNIVWHGSNNAAKILLNTKTSQIRSFHDNKDPKEDFWTIEIGYTISSAPAFSDDKPEYGRAWWQYDNFQGERGFFGYDKDCTGLEWWGWYLKDVNTRARIEYTSGAKEPLSDLVLQQAIPATHIDGRNHSESYGFSLLIAGAFGSPVNPMAGFSWSTSDSYQVYDMTIDKQSGDWGANHSAGWTCVGRSAETTGSYHTDFNKPGDLTMTDFDIATSFIVSKDAQTWAKEGRDIQVHLQFQVVYEAIVRYNVPYMYDSQGYTGQSASQWFDVYIPLQKYDPGVAP